VSETMNCQYCTLFDHRYLPRGLAMIRSLRRAAPGSVVWVLCLDNLAQEMLSRIGEPGVCAVSLDSLEASDPSLARVKHDGRSLVEYYFTCKASLIAYVLHAAPEADVVSYLDADLWFFSNPAPLFEEAANAPVILTPHRFPPRRHNFEAYGKYNAGWLSFRRSEEGLSCLKWWHDRCLDWCRDRVDEENQRFADQRYLDFFANRFRGTHALRHKGANLGPWNVGACQLAARVNTVLVDAEPLIFFHFHGVVPISQNFYLLPAHEVSGVRLNRVMRYCIYEPYLRELRRIEHETGLLLLKASVQPLRYLSNSRDSSPFLPLRRGAKIMRALFYNSLIRVTD
jgi:hypothetical protein